VGGVGAGDALASKRLWDANPRSDNSLPPPATADRLPFEPYGGWAERAVVQYTSSVTVCGLNVDMNVVVEDSPWREEDEVTQGGEGRAGGAGGDGDERAHGLEAVAVDRVLAEYGGEVRGVRKRSRPGELAGIESASSVQSPSRTHATRNRKGPLWQRRRSPHPRR